MSGKFIFAMVLLLGAMFLAGYIPQRLENRRLQETLRTTEVQLRLADLHRQLGLATLEAQRFNYANAGAAASRFFDGCAQLAGDPALANEPRTRTALGAYAASRDQIAGQLAMADPQAAQRLAGMFFAMNGVVARRE